MSFNVKAILVIIVGSVIAAGLYSYSSYIHCLEDCKAMGLSPRHASAACGFRFSN